MIRLEHVHFTYGSEQLVLEDLTLHIHKGERVGIVGANGAGKTTLLLIIAGLLHPHKGTVHIAGQPQPQKFRTLRKKIGFLFPDPDDQLLYPRVEEELRAATNGTDSSVLDRVVQRFGLAPWMDRPIHTLSPGLKKRLALATLFLRKPEVWLLDEPTAGLDPRTRKQLIQDIRELPGTLLVATHDLDFVWDVCERTLLLEQGHLQADGPTRVLLQDHNLLQRYGLDLPLKLQGGHV